MADEKGKKAILCPDCGSELIEIKDNTGHCIDCGERKEIKQD